MESAQTGLEQLKQRMRSTWMAGDCGQIAQLIAKGPPKSFVGRIGLKPASSVLDALVRGEYLEVLATRT